MKLSHSLQTSLHYAQEVDVYFKENLKLLFNF